MGRTAATVHRAARRSLESWRKPQAALTTARDVSSIDATTSADAGCALAPGGARGDPSRRLGPYTLSRRCEAKTRVALTRESTLRSKSTSGRALRTCQIMRRSVHPAQLAHGSCTSPTLSASLLASVERPRSSFGSVPELAPLCICPSARKRLKTSPRGQLFARSRCRGCKAT